MIYSDKKAQLGKIISSVPLMILIFVIMGLFVMLAAGFSLAKGSKDSPKFVYGNIAQDDLMSQEVSVAFPGEQAETMLVIDALAKSYSKKDYEGFRKEGLSDYFKPLVDAEHPFLFYRTRMGEPGTIEKMFGYAFSNNRACEMKLTVRSGVAQDGLYDLSVNGVGCGVDSSLIGAFDISMRRISFEAVNETGARNTIYADYYYGGIGE